MFMYRLVSDSSSKLFFISRPRRFGKSLTISALKALFSGRRELFEGLAIDKMDWAWEKYPVIHFEFNDLTTTSLDEFAVSLAYHVRSRLEEAGFAYDKTIPMPENFGKAIETLSAANGGKGVAILIDEYDAPVGHCLDNIEMAEAVRARLSAVYSQMKNRTGDIRFLLMNYLRREDVLRINPERIGGIPASEFDVAELRYLRPVAMLFQSGYLTIKDYNPLTEAYTLGVPDEEVRRDFCTLMAGAAETFENISRYCGGQR